MGFYGHNWTKIFESYEKELKHIKYDCSYINNIMNKKLKSINKNFRCYSNTISVNEFIDNNFCKFIYR